MKLFVMMLTLLSLSGAWAQVAPGGAATGEVAATASDDSVVEDCEGAQNGDTTNNPEVGPAGTPAQGTDVQST